MYIDGYLVPVPEARVEDYLAHAKLAGEVWMEHGALAYVEAQGEDVPVGKQTDFFRAVDRQAGETVFFSYIVYRDRAHRDEVNAKVFADPRMAHPPADNPFDGKRMIWGGFEARIALPG